jgi:transcriptional regulator with XRE-family HTH domain
VAEEAFYIIVRRRIRKARNALGLTQEEVAELVDMTLEHYQTFEIVRALQKGKRFNPTLKNLRGIAKAVRTPLSTLIAEPNTDEIKELGSDGTEKRKPRT